MAQLTITTDEGAVVTLLKDYELPVRDTVMARAIFWEKTWPAIEQARVQEKKDGSEAKDLLENLATAFDDFHERTRKTTDS
jgi:hypothetical protein